MSIERDLEIRELRRLRADARWIDKMDRRERDAAPMIGELCRDGRTVYYVRPAGGRYRESGSYTDLVGYLARNGYIR